MVYVVLVVQLATPLCLVLEEGELFLNFTLFDLKIYTSLFHNFIFHYFPYHL